MTTDKRAEKMKRVIVLADEQSPRVVNGSGHVKALAKVDGLPLIIRNLRTLYAAGVEEAVVVTGFEAEQVSKALVLMSDQSQGSRHSREFLSRLLRADLRSWPR